MAEELSLNKVLTNTKVVKAVMALIANRKKILSKGTNKYATFYFMGKSVSGDFPNAKLIQLGLTEVIIGDVKFKLPKPKGGK